MAFSENLDAFLADFGVVAIYNAETAKVIFDLPDQIVAGDVVSADYQITYKTGSFSATLMYAAAITVDGQAYTVGHTALISDGRFTVTSLNKV